MCHILEDVLLCTKCGAKYWRMVRSMRIITFSCLFFTDVPRVLQQGLCPCCQAEMDDAVAELNRELAGPVAWYLRPENAGFAAREREWSQRNW